MCTGVHCFKKWRNSVIIGKLTKDKATSDDNNTLTGFILTVGFKQEVKLKLASQNITLNQYVFNHIKISLFMYSFLKKR